MTYIQYNNRAEWELLTAKLLELGHPYCHVGQKPSYSCYGNSSSYVQYKAGWGHVSEKAIKYAPDPLIIPFAHFAAIFGLELPEPVTIQLSDYITAVVDPGKQEAVLNSYAIPFDKIKALYQACFPAE